LNYSKIVWRGVSLVLSNNWYIEYTILLFFMSNSCWLVLRTSLM